MGMGMMGGKMGGRGDGSGDGRGDGDEVVMRRTKGRTARGIRGTGPTNAPSSFLRTRSTAPEQPPQVIVMVNL